MDADRDTAVRALERRVARLAMATLGLALIWIVTVAWFVLHRPAPPPVLAVERLEIREPDGNLAFALAGSGHPTPGTIDGRVLLSDQVEDRRFPHFIYFDGRGDEAGGLMMRTVDGPDGASVSRFLTFDGYKHQETLVLGHNQGPSGTATGLRIFAHQPGATLLGGLAKLGVEPGVTRAQLDAAIEAVPPDERQHALRDLVGVTRLELGTTPGGEAGLTLNDAEGRPRIILEAPADGLPSLRFLDESGAVVLRLPAEA